MTQEIPVSVRLPSLDGWRAVAIMLVLLSHFPYAANFPNAWRERWQLAIDGDLGVRIFFVLSGFLITRLILQEHIAHGRLNLKRFYIRRSLRIFPLYFSYLGVLALLQLVGAYSDVLSSWIGALTFTRNVVGQGQSATVHFWSLAIEEQFYLFWPTVVVLGSLCARRRRAVGVLVFFVLVAVATRGFVAHQGADYDVNRIFGLRSVLRYLDSLAIGCLAAVLPLKVASHRKSLLVSSVALAASFRVLPHALPNHLQVLGVITPLIEAIVIAVLIHCSIVQRSGLMFSFLNSAPMVSCGVLSYSLYVWHVMFLSHFMGSSSAELTLYDWKLWLLPSILVAYISHRCVEQPFLRLKQRVAHQQVDAEGITHDAKNTHAGRSWAGATSRQA
jgi:peptidoglycan/LPS O-acetylase OafA/YrhL